MSLISYMKTATNKRLLISESRGDTNRCTLCRGKSDQRASHFSRSVRVWPSTIRISYCPCIVTFHEVINSDGQSHYSWEKGLPTQSTTQWLTDPWVCTQFLFQTSHWRSRCKATLYWRQATRLTGFIYQHVIGMINTCSRGPTHRYLTDTGGDYNLGGAGFPHTTPRPSQPMVSTFHLRVLPSLELSIQQLQI
jgi:hypothetical protein